MYNKFHEISVYLIRPRRERLVEVEKVVLKHNKLDRSLMDLRHCSSVTVVAVDVVVAVVVAFDDLLTNHVQE